MASLIETVSGISNGASPGVDTATFGTPTLAGELIVIAVATGSTNGNAPATVTDDKSQVYTLIESYANISSNWFVGLYYLENSAAGASVITVTNTAGDLRGGIIAQHYSGVVTSGALDKHTKGTSTGGTFTTGATATTTQADELLIGVCRSIPPTATLYGLASDSPWNQDASIPGGVSGNFDGNNRGGMVIAHRIVAATGAYAYTGTDSMTTADDRSIIATFAISGAWDKTISAVPTTGYPITEYGSRWYSGYGDAPLDWLIGPSVDSPFPFFLLS